MIEEEHKKPVSRYSVVVIHGDKRTPYKADLRSGHAINLARSVWKNKLLPMTGVVVINQSNGQVHKRFPEYAKQ